MIFIFTVSLLLINSSDSIAYNDIGIGISPLSVNENAFGLSFSAPVNKLRYGIWGLDGSFYITQEKFDHKTTPEYSGGWG